MHQSDTVSRTASPSREAQGQPPAETGFRPDIEGLRGLTLLAILGFHIAMPGLGGGFVGPDIFFFISGFVITGQLWREVSVTGTVGLRKFYGKRARRLLPVSALVGVVTAIAAALLLPPLQAKAALMDGIASALYVPNFWFIGQQVDYFADNVLASPFQHYWTLGVEEQFYLIWPPMIVGTAWLVRRIRRRPKTDVPRSKTPYVVLVALVAVSSFALSLMITYVMPLAAYFSLPTRAWQLAGGALVALTAGQWRRLPQRVALITGWIGLALILFACAYLTPATPYPGTASLLPWVGTALVIGAGCAAPTRGAGRLLAVPPMRALGRWSYSWYLWHWPALVFVPILLGHSLGLAGNVMVLAASGVLAVLTLRVVENPLRYAAFLRKSPAKSLAVGSASSALAACVSVALLLWVSSIPLPVPVGHGAQTAPLTITAGPVASVFGQVQTAVAASADLKAVPSNLSPPLADAGGEVGSMLFNGCLRAPLQSGQPECAMGDTASKTTVAIVGDSHASMWIPALQQIGTQRPWRMEAMAKAACPMMDLPIANPLVSRLVEYVQRCEQWRGQIIERLRAEHPKLVMVSVFRSYTATNSHGFLSGFTSYDPAWNNALTRLVRQLRETGAKVLVLGPLPALNTSVPGCLSEHLDDATACSPPMSTAFNRPGIAAEAAAVEAGGGQYADLTDLFCTGNRCPVIIGNTLVYVDAGHLTLEYSRLLAPALEALADRALAQS
ncbi:acyltransferase family protein [Mycobacterium sp. NPDC048908]|uniref:acyltransferase family protein n=1 Tax=Mycobacterium sp. NPDC048908 TaxID=3364292 RepID=UPI0037106DC5